MNLAEPGNDVEGTTRYESEASYTRNQPGRALCLAARAAIPRLSLATNAPIHVAILLLLADGSTTMGNPFDP